MKKSIYLLCGIYLAMAGIASPAIAQQLKLGNNPTQISKTALLELESTNQGLLLPRISDTNAFHPNPIPDGMLIFYVGTSDSCLMIRKDGVWIKIVDFANLASRETDPIATAKTVSVTSGYGLTGGGSNTLGNNPSFTLNVDTTKLATQNYVNNRYTSGFGVNVNNSTGVVSADTSSGRLATQNYVNNRYTGGTGISVNNSTGVITNTGVVTETDPIANAKSITVSAGYGLSGGGTNTLGNNPSFTLNVDTTKLATQNYVNNRYTSGFGVNVNNSTGIVSADTTKVTTTNYVNNRYTSGFGVNVNNSTGVVSADTSKITTTNYVNNRYTSGFGVNVNNSTGVVSADTSSGKLATQNYVNNRYTGGTGISVNNSTGVITNTGVVTETDPVANAKSITVSAGYGLSGGGTNTLGNNPS
ncbi:MAG: hypothetical protein K6T34_07595, partial [Thermoflavifilum sp.]|nr:hypothetical protein [Thermoflavifilum sp.]